MKRKNQSPRGVLFEAARLLRIREGLLADMHHDPMAKCPACRAEMALRHAIRELDAIREGLPRR